MIFLQNIASLLERGVRGYRRNATRARRRIASLAYRHVSPELFICRFEFLHSCSMRIVDLIEIAYLYGDVTWRISNDTQRGTLSWTNPISLTSLLNLSCSERTVISYRFSIFLISCSSLNLSFVNLVFSTSIWLCERVRWSSSFLRVDMVALAVSASSSSCLILPRNWNGSDNWSFVRIFLT